VVLRAEREEAMWYGIGFGALIYLVLLFTCGVLTIRNKHLLMFFLGVFFPILWLIGAIMRPKPAEAM
jgi:hypothetical protein